MAGYFIVIALLMIKLYENIGYKSFISYYKGNSLIVYNNKLINHIKSNYNTKSNNITNYNTIGYYNNNSYVTPIDICLGLLPQSIISKLNEFEKQSSIASVPINKLILYEDKYLIICYKPPTILSQPDVNSNYTDTKTDLLTLLQTYVNNKVSSTNDKIQLMLIHRIDRPCSGLMVFTKTKEATAGINEQFTNRTITKEYLCIVNGKLSTNGICNNYIVKTQSSKVYNVKDKLTESEIKTNRYVKAVLNYESVYTFQSDKAKPKKNSTVNFNNYQSLLKISLDTGRKHQIRCQLSHLGYSICGDDKYGAKQKFQLRDIALHAYNFSLSHPITNKRIDFKIDPPSIWTIRFGEDVMAKIDDLIR